MHGLYESVHIVSPLIYTVGFRPLQLEKLWLAMQYPLKIHGKKVAVEQGGGGMEWDKAIEVI